MAASPQPQTLPKFQTQPRPDPFPSPAEALERTDPQGVSPIHRYMVNECVNVEVLTRILEHDQQAMERCDSTSFTPLHMYCELNKQVSSHLLGNP